MSKASHELAAGKKVFHFVIQFFRKRSPFFNVNCVLKNAVNCFIDN